MKFFVCNLCTDGASES